MRGDRPQKEVTVWSGLKFTPHARGSTRQQLRNLALEWFTPHARGSTLAKIAEEEAEKVYPACAGIDPMR